MAEHSAQSIAYFESKTDSRSRESARLMMSRILEMRTAGLTFPQIARELGFTQKHAFTMWQRAMDAIIAPQVEQLRKQEAERLDAMLVPCMSLIMAARDKALIGATFDLPVDAINAALKISEKRSRLFGLDAPLKIERKPKVGNPSEILENMNLSNMDMAELLKFRELMQKAHENGPLEDPDDDDTSED